MGIQIVIIERVGNEVIVNCGSCNGSGVSRTHNYCNACGGVGAVPAYGKYKIRKAERQ